MKFGLERIADGYMQIWNADSEGLLEVYAADDLVVHYTHFQKIEGVDAYKEFLRNTYKTFPDLKITIGEIIIRKEKKSGYATVFWNYTGTHQEHVLFGVKPQEKEISVNGITVLTIDHDKVIREKGIVDNLSLLMQLNNPQQ